MRFLVLSSALLLVALSHTSCSKDFKQYEPVVAAVGMQTIPDSIVVRFHMDDFSDSTTLVALPEDYAPLRSEGKGKVSVYKTANNLLIFVQTEIYGHDQRGNPYGYIHSENGQRPDLDPDGIGMSFNVGKQLHPNWWELVPNFVS